jgi:hypothetical protein
MADALDNRSFMKRIVTFAILALLLVGSYFAIKLLPWWAMLLGVVATFFVGKLLVARLFRKLLIMPFRAKGAVLKAARVQIHSVEPIRGGSQSEPTRVRYRLDVTISPTNEGGAFNLWEPGELRLVLPESKIDLDSSSEDEGCEIQSIEVEQEDRFRPDEGLKYSGPQRLKLCVAVVPGRRELKFRYYFEEFGQVRLPEVTAKAA